MFKVGELVKVDPSEISHLMIPVEEISGLLVINDLMGTEKWTGQPVYEVRNSEGDYFGLLHNALVSV